MKVLKFTKETSTIALAFFIVYFVYGIFYTPAFQLLICLALGGIAYGITESYEVATIALLVMNYLFPLFRGSSMRGVTAYRMEGFAGSGEVKADEITKRIGSMTGSGGGGLKVGGVGSSMSEGFADAGDMDLTLNQNKKEGEHSTSVSASAKPASLNSEAGADKEEQLKKMADMMSTMVKAMNGGDSSSSKKVSASAKEEDVLASSTAVKISEQNVPSVHQPQDKESFATQAPSGSEGLFKLGQIPKDVKGGFHIDAGTTVMNAINSLKPDQIKAMTMDTKQLIDTQKSLMGMLQTFQPMVQEGKQMMDTFQEMFSPSMGAMGGKQ